MELKRALALKAGSSMILMPADPSSGRGQIALVTSVPLLLNPDIISEHYSFSTSGIFTTGWGEYTRANLLGTLQQTVNSSGSDHVILTFVSMGHTWHLRSLTQETTTEGQKGKKTGNRTESKMETANRDRRNQRQGKQKKIRLQSDRELNTDE